MIDVQQTSTGDPLQFTVVVREATGETTHRVSMSAALYRKLARGRVSEAGFIQAAFRFLLEREPKESILRSFDVAVIGRYFPEFERAIGSYLDK